MNNFTQKINYKDENVKKVIETYKEVLKDVNPDLKLTFSKDKKLVKIDFPNAEQHKKFTDGLVSRGIIFKF